MTNPGEGIGMNSRSKLGPPCSSQKKDDSMLKFLEEQSSALKWREL
jgi:hypothetical protein